MNRCLRLQDSWGGRVLSLTSTSDFTQLNTTKFFNVKHECMKFEAGMVVNEWMIYIIASQFKQAGSVVGSSS